MEKIPDALQANAYRSSGLVPTLRISILDGNAVGNHGENLVVVFTVDYLPAFAPGGEAPCLLLCCPPDTAHFDEISSPALAEAMV